MSDDYTDYNAAYSVDESEPETVEDLPAEDPAVEEFIEEVEIEEPEVEEVVEEEVVVDDVLDLFDPNDKYVRAAVDDNGKVRVRAEPDGEVLTLLTNKPRLRVLKDDNPEWTFVEFDDDGENVQGYIKKSFLVEA